ncbi:MAG TPA: hypothetical protein VHB98_10430 [Chloroflexota bacterium]|nr:hypothetical protein [Chloroflexota bacterium]
MMPKLTEEQRLGMRVQAALKRIDAIQQRMKQEIDAAQAASLAEQHQRPLRTQTRNAHADAR